MQIVLTGVWKEALEVFPELKKAVPAAMDKALYQEAQDLRKRMVRQFREQKPASGPPWAPLSPNTLKSRKAQGFGGKKILIRTGDLRNSIRIEKPGKGVVFVGVNRTAGYVKQGHKSQQKKASKQQAMSFRAIKPGKGMTKRMQLVNLGLVHEFGATVKITVTRAMQRYVFGVLGLGGGIGGAGSKGPGGRDSSGRFTKGKRKKGRGGFAVPSKSRRGGAGGFRVGAKITIKIPARPFVAPAVNAMTIQEYEMAIAVKVAILLKGKLGKP